MPDAESMNRTGAARERAAAAVVFQEYLKAAQEGSVGAQHDVGLLYAAGHGVAQDFGEALRGRKHRGQVLKLAEWVDL